MKDIIITIITILAQVIIYAPLASGQTPEPKTITSTGVVIPNRSVTLSAKIMGLIEKVSHEEGALVKKGEVMILINNSELQADLASAKASLELARTDANHKTKVEAQMRKLFGEKTIPEDRLDSAVLELNIARQKIRIAEASIAKIQAMITETVIKAPFDAVVISKTCEVGQVTQPGSALYRIEDQSRLKFRSPVKDNQISKVKPGQKVIITISAIDGTPLTGTVIKIIPSSDASTHSFPVEVTLPKQEGLYPGMFGTIVFQP